MCVWCCCFSFLIRMFGDVQPHRRVSDVAYARIHGSRLPPTALAAATTQQRWQPHRKLWIAKRVRRRQASSRASKRRIGRQMGIYLWVCLCHMGTTINVQMKFAARIWCSRNRIVRRQRRLRWYANHFRHADAVWTNRCPNACRRRRWPTATMKMPHSTSWWANSTKAMCTKRKRTFWAIRIQRNAHRNSIPDRMVAMSVTSMKCPTSTTSTPNQYRRFATETRIKIQAVARIINCKRIDCRANCGSEVKAAKAHAARSGWRAPESGTANAENGTVVWPVRKRFRRVVREGREVLAAHRCHCDATRRRNRRGKWTVHHSMFIVHHIPTP